MQSVDASISTSSKRFHSKWLHQRDEYMTNFNYDLNNSMQLVVGQIDRQTDKQTDTWVDKEELHECVYCVRVRGSEFKNDTTNSFRC